MRRLAMLVLVLVTLSTVAWAQLTTGGLPNVLAKAPATASSAAGPAGGKYGPQDASDGNPGTWWAAYNKGAQWLEVKLPAPQRIDTLVLSGANQPNLYTNWKQVIIRFDSGEPLVQDFPDTQGPFVVKFPARDVQSVRLEILSVYGADKVYVGVGEIQGFLDPDQRVKVKVSPVADWRRIDLTEKPRAEHPCVYHTRADVASAQERLKREPWAKSYADSVIASANDVLKRPEEWFRQMMPGKGACFAYGLTGCPICRESWGTWGGANCTWDNPGHVKCGKGHVLPDADHPDPGTGYKGPDGRIHYFVGSWNAWVTEKFIHDYAGNCALAYALTGDEKYARRAAFILDLIADIYPSCDKGSWDYPSDPPSGRLARPWYQVARVLVRLVDFYDLIYHSTSLDEPSVTAGLTRRANIETNMLKNGAAYCYEQSLHGGLNNGEADYIRGAMAVGCLLGIESYVRWAYDGPYGILALVDNNVCRDGRYFETSVMYADHSRELYLTFGEPLFNYRSASFPNGINVYDNPKFQSFYVVPALSIAMLGHSPRFGDSGPDVGFLLPPKHPTNDFDQHLAELFYTRSQGQAKADFGQLVAALSAGDVVKARLGVPDKEWMLFHASPPPEGKAEFPDWLDRRINDTNFFGQKGLAFLRSGRDVDAQAALVRFGPSLNHGHYDDLNLNYYGLGYELTYDLGYGLGSTHTQVGWGKATASHNTVLVDEVNQGPDDRQDGSGGSLFLSAGLPGLQLADCSAEGTYASHGVTEYRRLTALVGSGRETYLLDLFRVKGGKQHDYMMHSQSQDVDFGGVTLSAPEEGSLAGKDLAWGDKQLNDGDLAGFPNKPYWNPPPGNGFGFLMNPQRATAPTNCTATWKLPGNHDPRLRMTLLSEPNTELVTAWAPGIYPEKTGAYGNRAGLPKARWVMARRQGEAPLTSTFISVLEPYSKPLPPRGREADELVQGASVTAGELKPLPAYNTILFKATGPQDELRVTVPVEQAGQYVVHVGLYGSPNYGTVQVKLDGQVLSPLVNEHNETAAGTPLDAILGTHDLPAGEHVFALSVVKPVGENYWVGLQSIGLVPAAQAPTTAAAEPFLAEAKRLPAPDGTYLVQVDHRNGLRDTLLYAPNRADEPNGYTGLGRVTTRGAQLESANLVGGEVLNAAVVRLKLPQAGYKGQVTRVDYEANKLYVDAVLPTDGRLNGQPVYLSNPRYSRNTVYHIVDVQRAGAGSVIDLGQASLSLGFADLDDDPLDAHAMTTLNPHEYSRALGRPDSGFFHGKLLATEDGKLKTTIRTTTFGQPFRIEVDSTAGFRKGMRVHYYDVQAGDSFRMDSFCSLVRQADGSYRVTGNSDVTFEAKGGVELQTAQGWQKVTGLQPWRPEGCVIRLAGAR